MTDKKTNVAFLCVIFIIFCLFLYGTVSAEMTVRVLDIGQGDAILLESNGEWMLFDAGPQDTTVDLLHHYGITHLDYFVTSRPDTDHIGGAAAVIRSFPIDVYADSGATHTTKVYENMITALVEGDIAYSRLVRGNSWRLGDAKVQVLTSGEGTNSNDKSVVLHLTDGNVTFLFPGDKEDIKEWEAMILVAPHHGSAGVHLGTPPEVALISVGENNRYGHPAQAVLDLFEASGVQVYRTDLNGTITIVSDGQSYTISTEYDSGNEQQDDNGEKISAQKRKTDAPIEEGFSLRVLDIGQGDAILLESNSEWMLFDAGPRNKTVDLLHHYGVTHLDYFVTSHPDADHIGGAAAVIRSFPIDTYADSGATHTTRIYENMITALVEEDVAYSELVRGDSWTLGAVTVDVLSSGDGSNNNDQSVVLRITHDDITFLLPGDREKIKEWEATILVVPHHGSAGLRLGIPPEVALISVGQNNRYGHPAQATLDRFESLDVEVHRTDTDGTITVISDGQRYAIFTEGDDEIRADELAESEPEPIISEGEPELIINESEAEPIISESEAELIISESEPEPCDCSGDLMNCGDFEAWEDAQACYEHCIDLGKGDIHRLDVNNDGAACDSLR